MLYPYKVKPRKLDGFRGSNLATNLDRGHCEMTTAQTTEKAGK